jgi:dipeptidyl aminopeptidase/acylaminoacyl peptidase
MRYSFLLLFLCLPFLAGRESAAQTEHDSLLRTAEKYYRLTDLKMSEDGRWLIFRKSYDLNRDTVLILSSRYPEQPVCYRTKVEGIIFLSNNNLLMRDLKQAELLNPDRQTSIYYNGVKQIRALKSNRQFLLHYDEKGNNRLELRDSRGELLNRADHVNRFYTSENNHIFAVTENESGNSVIVLLKDKIAETIYITPRKISQIKPNPNGKAIIISEQNPESDSMVVLYLDIETGTVYSFNTGLTLSIENCFSELIREEELYLMRLWIPADCHDSTLTDIWYGNDNQLEVKYHRPIGEICCLWKPGEKSVQRIGADINTKVVNIGNSNNFLLFNPYLLQDYIKSTSYVINIYNSLKGSFSLMDTISKELYTSPDGRYVIYQKNKAWHIYCIATGTKSIIENDRLTSPYFTNDSKTILFEGDGGLWHYDLIRREFRQINSFKGYQVTILDVKSRNILGGFNFYEKTVDIKTPLVLKLYNTKDNRSAYMVWRNDRYDTIVPPTEKHIQNLVYNTSFSHFCYTEEDYNLPPSLVHKKIGEDKKVLYQSNKADTAILTLKQEIIAYTNSDGVSLQGILLYPLHYNPSGKYPMVVHIYEKQRYLSNRYEYPSYYERLGFNIRLLIEKGYFVYLPDILIQGREDKGPGMDALDCVNNALDAIAGNQLIDKQRIGLIGHSFGGYETDFIATHSSRFAAYVSGAGTSDILHAYHSFNYNFKLPGYKRVEAGQYEMKVSFSDNKALYFTNNPVYHAERVNAPVLLWSGLEDRNVTSDQTMAFYNALRRNKKDVIALFYKGEGHCITNYQAQYDLTYRILDWFDFFLPEATETEWISKGMKEDAP